MITKDELLEKFDKLECEKLRDSHPEVHKLIADYILENFTIVRKECDHNWVNAENEVIKSGEWCTKCNSIRAKAEVA